MSFYEYLNTCNKLTSEIYFELFQAKLHESIFEKLENSPFWGPFCS